MKLGIYKHYKGHFYRAILIARDSNNFADHEDSVVYISLSPPRQGQINVRRVNEFCELVTWPDGVRRLRFEYVGGPQLQLKYGRLAPHPESTHPRLKLASFLRPGYALVVPSSVDYLSRVTSWPIYGNSEISDCTAAAAGHLRESWTCYGQGKTIVTADADVLTFYERVSGYVPGDESTDNGAVMQDCLDYWRKIGLAGDTILGFFQVDPANLAELKAALFLFGGLYVGLNMPVSAKDQFQRGVPWGVDPSADNSIEGGHCVHLGAIDADGMATATTWGTTQKITPAWWKSYAEECWAVATLDWIRNGLSPEGLDVPALNAQFEALTGQPGPFPVSPRPAPPIPTPPAVSVADQALAASISPGWLSSRHILPGNARVASALKAWFTAIGLEPSGK